MLKCIKCFRLIWRMGRNSRCYNIYIYARKGKQDEEERAGVNVYTRAHEEERGLKVAFLRFCQFNIIQYFSRLYIVNN